MSHDHKHDEHGHHHNHQTHPKESRPARRGCFFWAFLIAVVLMLASMFMYVMSDDESLQPGGGEGPPVPAAE